MTLADRIEHLFAQTAGPAGRPVTLQEIVDRMAERDISTISVSYLQQLRSGQAENPRVQHLRALADAFDVPLTYFFENQTTDAQSESPDEGADPTDLAADERDIALRVHGLSEDALDSIRAVVEIARRSENLDDPPSGRGDL